MTLEERFWSKVAMAGPDDCWPWTAAQSRNGYGNFYVDGSWLGAHRVAHYLTYGVEPGEQHVLHACDNKLCCNPHHLWLGTNQENTADKMNKGRGNQARGEQQGSAKLIEEQVLAIRDDPRAHRAIAAEYGIHHSSVCSIKKRKTWGWFK